VKTVSALRHAAIPSAIFCICLSCFAGPRTTVASARYKELARVIDKNVGHAHMTRGVNVCTILALRNRVTEQDIEVLAQLLESSDLIHRLAAGYVLSVLGPMGISALKSHGSYLGATATADLIARGDETTRALVAYKGTNRCATSHPVRGKRNGA
jgi:hypothetical protein